MEFSVLGLVGPAGSGKDLVADWFVSEKKFIKVAFADPMKRFVLRTFPAVTAEQLWGPSEERNREFEVSPIWWFETIGHFGEGSTELVQDVLEEGIRVEAYLKLHEWLTWLHKTYPNKISVRVILQTLGTEWGREVDPLMWSKYAHKVAAKIKEGFPYTQEKGLITDLGPSFQIPGVVIPDHRFKNEIALTQGSGGHVIRLRRLANEGGEGNVGIQGHPSELEMRSIPDQEFDLVLEFEEGVDKVYEKLGDAWETRKWIRPPS